MSGYVRRGDGGAEVQTPQQLSRHGHRYRGG
jgi:hypothetical protein